MTENDEIEVELVSEEGLDIEAVEASDKKPKRGLGLLPVLGLTSLAAILGAIGGAFGTQYVTPQKDVTAEVSMIEAGLRQSVKASEETTTKERLALENKLTNIERQLRLTMSDTTLSENLERLSARLDGLETTLPSEIAAIDPETLSALSRAQADDFTWPSLSGIEADIDTLKNDIQQLSETVQNIETQGFDRAMAEDRVEESMISSSAERVAFPLETLMTLAKAQTEPKNFLARTLSKHIAVQDPSDPTVILKKIAKADAVGNSAEAIKAFDKLPANLREAAQDWRRSVGQ